MGYTTLSIRKNNRIGKYILFYADYLQEAWLSEVLDNDTTKIVRQFRCKDTLDFELLTASLSNMGEIINLNSNETIAQHLSVLEMKLEKPFAYGAYEPPGIELRGGLDVGVFAGRRGGQRHCW